MTTLKNNKVIETFISLFILLMMLLMCAPVSAHETIEYNDADMITPRYEVVCNGLTYHDMIYKGRGQAISPDSGGYLVYEGPLFQCRGCNQVMVTEGNPLYGERINFYGIWQAGSPLSGTYHSFIATTYGISWTNTVDGYQFRR